MVAIVVETCSIIIQKLVFYGRSFVVFDCNCLLTVRIDHFPTLVTFLVG